jgi:hypothetical protein
MTETLLPVSLADLVATQPTRVAWLWHGYIARGNVTLLTSQWKSGKTTLLSVLMSRLVRGGKLAGRAVARARAVVVSEESPAVWRLRGDRLALGKQTLFFCRPFPGKPKPAEWLALLDRIVEMRRKPGVDLVVIDPLSSFLPAGTENNADALLSVLRPLERLTQAGLAVVVLHHPKKGFARPGQAARGSGALAAYVDVLMEMSRVPGAPCDDRRRKLASWSRHDVTPGELYVELSADGRDYTVAAPPVDVKSDAALERGLKVIEEVLTRNAREMTRTDVYEEWPERPRPSSATLWRWLDRGFERGVVLRIGTGRSGDPFRYAVQGKQSEPWEPKLEELLSCVLPPNESPPPRHGEGHSGRRPKTR